MSQRSAIKHIPVTLRKAIRAKDWESVLVQITELKREAQNAQLQLFLAIRYIEIEARADIMNLRGWLSFESFIKDHCHIRESRYRDFVAVLDRDGEAAVLARGLDACLAVKALRKGSPKLLQIDQAIAQWRKENNGVQPSYESAVRIVQQIAPEAREPKTLKNHNEIQQLRAENAELKAEVRKLRVENAKLKRALNAPHPGA